MADTERPEPPLTDDELAEAERLEREATPGPWFAYDRARIRAVVLQSDGRGEVVRWTGFDGQPNARADAAFIAAARHLIPRLTAEVRRLRAERAGAEAWRGLSDSQRLVVTAALDDHADAAAHDDVARAFRAAAAALREARRG